MLEPEPLPDLQRPPPALPHPAGPMESWLALALSAPGCPSACPSLEHIRFTFDPLPLRMCHLILSRGPSCPLYFAGSNAFPRGSRGCGLKLQFRGSNLCSASALPEKGCRESPSEENLTFPESKRTFLPLQQNRPGQSPVASVAGRPSLGAGCLLCPDRLTLYPPRGGCCRAISGFWFTSWLCDPGPVTSPLSFLGMRITSTSWVLMIQQNTLAPGAAAVCHE